MKKNIDDLYYENKMLMRGRTMRILKIMCFIGGIVISNNDETHSENYSTEPYIPNKFYDEWYYNDDNDKLKFRN